MSDPNEPVGMDAEGDAVVAGGGKWTLRQAVAYTCDNAPLTMPAAELAEKTSHAFVGTNLGRDIIVKGIKILAEEGLPGQPSRLPEGEDPEAAALHIFERMPERERVALLTVAMTDLIRKYREEVAVSNRTTIPDGDHR